MTFLAFGEGAWTATARHATAETHEKRLDSDKLPLQRRSLFAVPQIIKGRSSRREIFALTLLRGGRRGTIGWVPGIGTGMSKRIPK